MSAAAAVGSDTLLRLLSELFDSAAAYALSRSLERRPDLDKPSEPRVVVPPEEELRVSLDRLAYVAWLEQGLALASDVPVAAALRAGASLGQLAEALRCRTEEARERYDHLALLAGNPSTAAPEGGDGR